MSCQLYHLHSFTVMVLYKNQQNSALLAVLEDGVNVSAPLPQANDQTCTCMIIDRMTLIQMMKTGDRITFGDQVYFNTITTFYEQYNCSHVDIVFDSYRDMSIKSCESKK